MRNHQFALIRREAKWELVESSERKKAKDEVARSEAKYRSLVENTGQGVATTDLKGRFTYVNETLCKMIGYDEKELLGKNFADFLHPDEKKRILNLFWEVLKTLRRKRLHLEFRVIHKKGHVLHWYSSPTAFRHKGRILGFSAIITDITDRKKIEKVLKNAAREWYATFDAISDAVLLTDLEGKVLRCNKAMADLMRRPFREIVGDTCWQLLYGAPGPLEGSPMSLMKKGRSRQTAFVQKGERYFQIDVDPLLDQTRDLIGAVHIMTDITDRKRAERRIQEQNEFLNSVLESFAHPLYVVDVNDYTVRMANSAAGLGKISKDLTCYAAHYKRNRPCEGTEHPCPIQKVRRTKQPVVVEHLHYDKDGSPRHTEVHTYPIFDDEGNLSQMIEYSLDITERKKAEEKLRESESRYRSLFENMLDGFAYCKILLDENNRPTDFVYLEINDALERLTGLKKENVVGKKATEAIPGIKDSHPELFDIYGEVALTGKEAEFEIYFKPLEIWLSISVHSPGKGYFVAVFDNITERKRAEQKIDVYQRRLRSLASELTLIEEREKRHLASELHDSIGQLLALCRIKLGELQTMTKISDSRSLAEEVEERLEEIIWHTRSLTLRLGPPVLYELGLEAALEWLAEYMQEQYGIQTKFKVGVEAGSVDEELRIFLFRAVQELMMNVAKHAEANKVKTSVWRENNRMHIVVEDRGAGFNTTVLDAPSGKDTGFGLFSIRERIKYFEGELRIQSKPGEGTQATLTVPLKTRQ